MITVAKIIFITTILISLYALYIKKSIIQKFSLHPYSLNLKKERYYTIITSGFIHAHIPHLIFNMMAFYFFAFNLESTIGFIHFFILYFLSLVTSDIHSIIKHKENPYYYSLGASGAISAIVFSYILFFPFSKIFIMPIPFGIPAPIFGVLYLGFCYYASTKNDSHINHDAHFWGAITGLVYTIVFFPETIKILSSFFDGIL